MNKKSKIILTIALIFFVFSLVSIIASKYLLEYTSDEPKEIVANNTNESICPEDEEPDFNDVLYKYYGNEKIDKLYMEIENEISGRDWRLKEKYPLTDNQKKMIDMAIDLIESKKLTEDEKNLLKDGLYQDLDYMEDEEYITKMKNAIGDYVPKPDDNPTK